MGRGLISGIEDHDVIMKQLRNGDQEHVILRRFPFHEAMTRQAALQQYHQATRLMFEIVPEDQWLAVMGRFNRKLVKRMRHFFLTQQRNEQCNRTD